MRASSIVSLKNPMLPNPNPNDLCTKYKEAKSTKNPSNKYANNIPIVPNDRLTKRNPADIFISTPIRSIIITILELEIPNNANLNTNSSDSITSNPMDIQVNCSTDSSYTKLMKIKMKGIDANVTSDSIKKVVPRIFEPEILDFFSRGYSRPSCVIVVTSITRL